MVQDRMRFLCEGRPSGKCNQKCTFTAQMNVICRMTSVPQSLRCPRLRPLYADLVYLCLRNCTRNPIKFTIFWIIAAHKLQKLWVQATAAPSHISWHFILQFQHIIAVEFSNLSFLIFHSASSPPLFPSPHTSCSEITIHHRFYWFGSTSISFHSAIVIREFDIRFQFDSISSLNNFIRLITFTFPKNCN